MMSARPQRSFCLKPCIDLPHPNAHFPSPHQGQLRPLQGAHGAVSGHQHPHGSPCLMPGGCLLFMEDPKRGLPELRGYVESYNARKSRGVLPVLLVQSEHQEAVQHTYWSKLRPGRNSSYLRLAEETSGGGIVPTEVRNPRLQGRTKPQQRVGGVSGRFWDPAVLSPRLPGNGVGHGRGVRVDSSRWHMPFGIGRQMEARTDDQRHMSRELQCTMFHVPLVSASSCAVPNFLPERAHFSSARQIKSPLADAPCPRRRPPGIARRRARSRLGGGPRGVRNIKEVIVFTTAAVL